VRTIANNDFFAISDQKHKSAKKQRSSFNKVAALVSVPADLMIDIYKAFILPHLEYCATVLVINLLSSGLCNKLELTNQFAIRTLMNLPKSTPYMANCLR